VPRHKGLLFVHRAAFARASCCYLFPVQIGAGPAQVPEVGNHASRRLFSFGAQASGRHARPGALEMMKRDLALYDARGRRRLSEPRRWTIEGTVRNAIARAHCSGGLESSSVLLAFRRGGPRRRRSSLRRPPSEAAGCRGLMGAAAVSAQRKSEDVHRRGQRSLPLMAVIPKRPHTHTHTNQKLSLTRVWLHCAQSPNRSLLTAAAANSNRGAKPSA
jgi:hypothetical protein